VVRISAPFPCLITYRGSSIDRAQGLCLGNFSTRHYVVRSIRLLSCKAALHTLTITLFHNPRLIVEAASQHMAAVEKVLYPMIKYKVAGAGIALDCRNCTSKVCVCIIYKHTQT